MHDVVVVGAGPAGALTARRLAERGHDVVLLEEHGLVGQPVHCTGLLGLEAFGEFDLPSRLILGQSDAARFWGATGESVLVQSQQVQAAVIDRAGLDQLLADRAADAGADVRLGWRVATMTTAADSVTVNADDGRRIRARVCVLACGASYRFHRALGLGLPEVFLQSAQLELAFPEVPEVEVRFGRGVAPSGFAWLVPFRRDGQSYARIGLMTEGRPDERFNGFLSMLSNRAGIDCTGMPAARQKMLPLGPVSRTFADRVVAVGDAAGLVKPTTGGGIYYGMISGHLAAEVLDDGLRRDRLTARFLRRYEARWRRRLGQEIRVGLAFRRIAARLSDESIDALFDVARVNGIVPLLQSTASFNWHGKAALALLGHPSFRKIAFKHWTTSPDSPL